MFDEILAEYRLEYIGMGNMPSTADQVIVTLSRFLRNFEVNYGVHMEGEKIVGLDAPVLKRWYASMTAAGHKMTTKNNYVALLNPFLTWASTMRYLVKNPEDDMPIYSVLKIYKLPKEDEIPEEERKVKYFTPEQVKMFMNEMPGKQKTRDRAILALFLATGLRVSELCSLTIGSIVGHERGLVYVKRKGGSWKYTEVADFCYKYLEDYLSTRDLQDLDAPLFLTSRKTPCNRQQIWDVLSRKERILGLQSGVHILRHTTISNVEKKGGAGVARDIANHTTLFMTNKYDHTTQKERLEAINKLDWCDL